MCFDFIHWYLCASRDAAQIYLRLSPRKRCMWRHPRPRLCFHLLLFFPSASERGGGQGDLQQSRQPSGAAEEAQEGPDGLHGPPAGPVGAQLRAAEVPERPGPHGAGGLSQPHRHAGQDLVPEPEVKTLLLLLKREGGGGGGGIIWFLTAGSWLDGPRDAMFSFHRHPKRWHEFTSLNEWLPLTMILIID